MTTDAVRRDRALAALQGLAVGDALGMPTQDLTRERIRADHGQITGLLPAGPHQVIAAGQPAGRITDDTEQMLIVADLLVRHGRVPADELARALDVWEQDMRRRGSLDLLGPSTQAAIAAVRAGVPPEQAGAGGTTNGAAMRIAPLGVLVPPEPLTDLVDRVVEACRVTHHTSVAIAGASAVAAAVSAGIDGADQVAAVEHAVRAAEIGDRRGVPVPGPSVAARTRWAVDLLRVSDDPSRDVYRLVGTTVATAESVVAALALAATAPDPWTAVCLAAGAGGDTDTVAAMAGAITGATTGTSAWPADVLATVRDVNDLHLEPVVDGLLSRRRRA